MSRARPPSLLAISVGRTIRDARGIVDMSQVELERRTGISQSAQSRFERGLPSSIDLAALEALAAALGGRMTFTFDAPFLAERVAQRDRVHARCVAHAAARLRRLGWLTETEVQIEGAYGPGWIDVLAFHPKARALLVIEVKTEIRDFGRIQRTLGWYSSRSAMAAARFGWRGRATTSVLLVLATEAVDAALVINRSLADTAFRTRARHLEAWLATPIDATSLPPGLAMIDPTCRAGRWLLPTRIDARRTPPPYADYAAVIRRLDGRPRSWASRFRTRCSQSSWRTGTASWLTSAASCG